MTAHPFGHRRLVAPVFVVLVLFSASSWAQPTITNFPPVVPAGPDYATDVLANPWDFADLADLGTFTPEYSGWTISGPTLHTQGAGAFLSGGRFAGTTTTGRNNLISMLFRGATDIISSVSDTVGVFDHKAIPTGRFGKVAVMMTLNAPTTGGMQAIFNQGPHGVFGGQRVNFGSPQAAGSHLYIVDLVTGTWYNSRGAQQPSSFEPLEGITVPWSGVPLMRGFTLMATTAAASINVEIDWVRITQRDGAAGAAAMPITFNGCVNREYSVEARIGSSFEVIHAATSGSGATTTAQVNHGVLAPGTWDVRVTCYPSGRGAAGQSSSAVTVVVNDPPHVTISSPDAAGGADYATTVKGDPWDMNSLSDIAAAFGITNASIVSDAGASAFQATSTGGDPALMLVNGPPAAAIDTSRFRFLTFALTVAFPGEISPGRLFWEQLVGGTSAIATSQDIFVHPGRNVYTIDLPQLTEPGGLDPECAACANLPWSTAPVRFLRFDPHELAQGAQFRLGPVTLSAPDGVAPGAVFPVQFSFADSDTAGSTYLARVYLDADRITTNGMTLMGTLSSGVAPNTPLTFNLNSAGVASGEYFVFVETQESRGGVVDTRGAYAGGPLRVGASGPQPPGAPVVTATQIASNPVSVAWTAGPGDPPTSFVLSAGTAPGASNFGTFPMGLQTTASGNVPFGVTIYVRVTAFNAAGATVSNEISFVAGPVLPGAPTMNAASVAGNRTVTLSWNPPSAGGAPTHYIVVARYPSSPAIIATLPVGGTSLVVPNVPPGSYVVTVVGVNAAGTGPESGGIVVNVP